MVVGEGRATRRKKREAAGRRHDQNVGAGRIRV
jgi:hypothetical protein